MARPSIGRIVHYTITATDAEQINRRRADARNASSAHAKTGYMVHIGNKAEPGDVYPLLITRVWQSQLVNGQLFLDGNDTLWVTSAHEGEGERTWQWPPRVEG